MAALALGSAACGVNAQGTARLEDDEDVPYGLLEAPPTTEASTPETVAPARADVCLLADGRLEPVGRPVPDDATLEDVLGLLADGPTPAEVDSGLSTALPEGALTGDVTASGGIATVDLAPELADTEGRRQLLAVAQVVCTLTGRPGIGQVDFTLEGEAVRVPRGDGSTSSGPLARDDYRDLGP